MPDLFCPTLVVFFPWFYLGARDCTVVEEALYLHICQHRHMCTHTGVSGIYSNLSRLWNAVLECQAQPIAWFLPICITASLSHLPFSLLSCVKSGTTVWHITRHELAGYGVGEEIAEYFQENSRTKSLCYTIAPPPQLQRNYTYVVRSLKNAEKAQKIIQSFIIPLLDISSTDIFGFSSSPFSMNAFIFNNMQVSLSIYYFMIFVTYWSIMANFSQH